MKRLARWLRTLADRIDYAEADSPPPRVDWDALAEGTFRLVQEPAVAVGKGSRSGR